MAERKGFRSILECGIAHGGAELLGEGFFGRRGFALAKKLFAQHAPGFRQIGIERRCPAQHRDRFGRFAEGCQRGAEFVMRMSGPRVRFGQGSQHAIGGLRVSQTPARRTQDQQHPWIVGCLFERRPRPFFGLRGILCEQCSRLFNGEGGQNFQIARPVDSLRMPPRRGRIEKKGGLASPPFLHCCAVHQNVTVARA